ncbi:MAG: class I SAM-dependent methyltransferase [Proteobacteria bacterium]|nr:class I SAM-dependent methyltransferase [Pseudomonadota bacterium]
MTAIYNTIGAGYDRYRSADPGITETLARTLGRPKVGSYLDLACGSGNYTIALARKGYTLTGLDISRRMLTAARQKSRAAGWVLGDGERQPFADRVFQGVVCILAIHHFHDLSVTFKECRRILCPGAPLVLFTGEAGQMRHYWLNTYFPVAMTRSMADMPTRALIERSLRDAGFADLSFANYFVSADLQDHFLYSGKHNPGFYLNDRARAGISTFARHGDEAETRQGLARLDTDITTGRFAQVRQTYRSDLGDYLFVSARRS